MKTTVEIPDPLFRQAKAYAASHGMSLREVFETGLRAVLEDQPSAGKPFRLKMITSKGRLVCDDNWETIRSLLYEGHGG
jgi:hypothetical protein